MLMLMDASTEHFLQFACFHPGCSQHMELKPVLTSNWHSLLRLHSMHCGVQALAFPVLYPRGMNHWGTSRPVQITISMYFRARILGYDTRFQVRMSFLKCIGFELSCRHMRMLGCDVQVHRETLICCDECLD